MKDCSEYMPLYDRTCRFGVKIWFHCCNVLYCASPAPTIPSPFPVPLSLPRRPYPHCNVVLQQQCIIALSSSRCYRIYVPHVQLAYDRNTNVDNICDCVHTERRQEMAWILIAKTRDRASSPPHVGATICYLAR